jgi:hypothetical protein
MGMTKCFVKMIPPVISSLTAQGQQLRLVSGPLSAASQYREHLQSQQSERLVDLRLKYFEHEEYWRTFQMDHIWS